MDGRRPTALYNQRHRRHAEPFGEARRSRRVVRYTCIVQRRREPGHGIRELCQFNQATTSIYWIVPMVFPAVVAEGKPHVLTTTVFRRTNGTPLAAGLCDTVGSGGSLGYRGNTIERGQAAGGRASR
jgi:hypothetical protein